MSLLEFLNINANYMVENWLKLTDDFPQARNAIIVVISIRNSG